MKKSLVLNSIKTNKTSVLILVIAVVVVGFLLVGQLTKPKGFRIFTINPALNKVTSLAPFIKVHLNESTTKDNVSIPTQSVVKSYEVSGKVITIYLNALEKGKRYTIVIDSIRSDQGHTLTKKKLSFTAKEGSWERLPDDQKEAVLKFQDEQPAYASDPILAYLPHQTPNYVLSAVIDKSELRLTIKITPSFADTLDDGTMDPETYDRYRIEALDYIRSLKLDPASYTIDVSQDNPYLDQD